MKHGKTSDRYGVVGPHEAASPECPAPPWRGESGVLRRGEASPGATGVRRLWLAGKRGKRPCISPLPGMVNEFSICYIFFKVPRESYRVMSPAEINSRPGHHGTSSMSRSNASLREVFLVSENSKKTSQVDVDVQNHPMILSSFS